MVENRSGSGNKKRLWWRAVAALAMVAVLGAALSLLCLWQGGRGVRASGPALAAPTPLAEPGGDVSLKVLSVRPAPDEQDVSIDSPITVEFNRAVVELTSLEEQEGLPHPLQLQPEVEGLGLWISPSRYGFYPEEGLSAATRYTATVPSQVTVDDRLKSDYVWHFSTQLPVVVSTSPFSGAQEVDLETTVSLVFDREMEHKSTEAAFSLQGKTGGKVKGKFAWTGKKLTFIPARPLERGQKYTARLAPGAKARDGQLPTAEPYSWNFSTISFLRVASASPAPGAEEVSTATIDTLISVQFNHPVVPLTALQQQESLLQPLTIDPPLKGKGEWLNTWIYQFRPTEKLLPSTVYKVTVQKGLSDTVDSYMPQEYTWIFTTPLPAIVSARPDNYSKYVDPKTDVRATFNQEMEHSSVEERFSLMKETGYEQDFGERSADWPVQKKGNMWMDYEGGRYHMEMRKTKTIGWRVLAGRIFTDFVLEADAGKDSGPDTGEYGLIFRRVGKDYYLFTISGDGQYRLRKRLNSRWVVPEEGEEYADWTDSDYINKGNADNKLKVECKGAQITLYVNDHKLATVTDTSLPAGQVGLAVGAYAEPNVKVWFDNLQVQEGKAGKPTREEVKGKFSWVGDTMIFTPGVELERGAWYRATVEEGAVGVVGREGIEGDYRWGFTVSDYPRLVSTYPADGQDNVPAGKRLELRFNVPMDWQSVLDNLTIAPEPTNVYTSPSGTEFRFNIYTKASTPYTVTLGGQAREKYGLALEVEHTLHFTTAKRSPSVRIRNTGKIGTYNAYVPTEVFVNHLNIPVITCTLYSMNRDTFITLDRSSKSWREFEPRASDLLREWTVELENPLNERLSTPIGIAEKEGESLSPGLYYFEIQAPGQAKARQIMILTRLGLTFKRAERQVMVWATDLKSGQGVAGVPLEVITEKRRDIISGETNEDGVFLAELEDEIDYKEALYAFADYGENFSVCSGYWDRGISSYDFGLSRSFGSKPYYASMYTERAIYRPGQKVYFKGVLRRDDDARYDLPDEVTELPVTIEDARGKEIYEENLTLGEFGTFHGELPLDDDASLGYYSIQARLDEQTFSTSFRVAEYRKPEFEVEVTADRDNYIQGDEIAVSAQANYFFGGPVANAPVQWRLMSSDYFFRGPEKGYRWIDYDLLWERSRAEWGKVMSEGQGQTDAEGRFTFKLPADISELPLSQNFTIEVEVTDVNDRTVAARTGVVVHKAQFYIGLRLGRYVGVSGKEQAVDVLTVDTMGEIAANKPLKVNFYQREWYSVEKMSEDGYYYWTVEYSDTLVSEASLTTDEEGKGRAGFTPEEGGEYKIEAVGKDEEGRETVSSTYLWVSSREYVSWRMEDTDRVELVTDKDTDEEEYTPGETAEILVPSPFAGATALLTIERGQVISYEILQLESNSEVIKVPILSEYTPNVYVSIVLVKGQTAEDPLPSFKIGYVNLPVSTKEKELEVTITPDKEEYYTPRETATFNVQVKDYKGEGVKTELSLALVDKAVETLAPDRPGRMMAAFYSRRSLGVDTGASLTLFVERVTEEERGGGGGGGEPGEGPEATVRREFPDTAFWDPTVVTDEEGQAKVSAKLPDSLTTWRLKARGVTQETEIGEADLDIVTSKDLIVRPVVPRFFVVGDQVLLKAAIHNNTPEDMPVEVSLEAEGLTLADEARQKVDVPAGGKQTVTWQTTVDTLISSQVEATATLLFNGQGEKFQDAVELTMPVYRYSTPEVVATAGQVEASVVEEIVLPGPVDTSQGELTLELAPTLAAGIKDGLNYLEHYPWHCTEQTISRFLGNVANYRALRALGVEDAELEARLPQQISTALQRLYSMQKYDGGWGWWLLDDSSPYLTAYALLGMVKAESAGFAVDEEVMNNAALFLQDTLNESPDISSSYWADRQAFILYVLAEYGEGDVGRTVKLYEDRDMLSNHGKAFLAMTLKILDPDEETRIQALVGDLMGRATLSATGARWGERYNSYWLMSTNLRSTAIVLDALAKVDPNNLIVPGTVRWLMNARQEGHWRTTQQTVWAILALTDYMEASGELHADYSYRVTFNDKLLDKGQADATNLAEQKKLVVAVAELLLEEANRLEITRSAEGEQTGEGKLYYSMYLRYFLPITEVEALDRGIAVTRQYWEVDPATLEETGRQVSSAKVGDIVKVRLLITATSDLHYLVVEDPLPSGFEAIDTSLRTVSAAADRPGGERVVEEDERYWWWWWRWYPTAVELRDEKLALFDTRLGRGAYQYTYLMRAGQAGEFHAMPTFAYQMYFPEVFGRSAGGMFVVEPGE